ncbi:MAG: hypothetical protein E7462_00960 [Ruminococcaceae bacterium]|nr:hypothetical protein [Oscillospiraceae bacterium]
MRRIMVFLMVIILLSGCAADSAQMDRAIALRGKVQQKDVSFDTELTADYGDKIYTFSMKCQGDKTGNLKFTVTEPQTIAGISGTVSQGSGKLSFDDQVLAFDILADGLISPVSGPWVLLETLRSGYLTSCNQEGELLRLAIDDSYEKNALHLDIWLDSQDSIQRAEIIWQGRRVLSMQVKNFTFL